jgi:hypothetical protein
MEGRGLGNLAGYLGGDGDSAKIASEAMRHFVADEESEVRLFDWPH